MLICHEHRLAASHCWEGCRQDLARIVSPAYQPDTLSKVQAFSMQQKLHWLFRPMALKSSHGYQSLHLLDPSMGRSPCSFIQEAAKKKHML